MKIGDIVRTPAVGIYGNLPAIVTKVGTSATSVHTGVAYLVYENDVLTPIATIELLPRSYTTSIKRFRTVRIHQNGSSREYHVCIGLKGDGYETRALEIRKLVFADVFQGKAQ